jgi:hypothetical protein
MSQQTYVNREDISRKGMAFHITHTWSVDKVDEYRKIKQIVGHGHVSALIEKLLLQWLQEQEEMKEIDCASFPRPSTVGVTE